MKQKPVPWYQARRGGILTMDTRLDVDEMAQRNHDHIDLEIQMERQ